MVRKITSLKIVIKFIKIDSKRLIGWKSLADLPIAENRDLWTFDVDTRDVRYSSLSSKR